MEFKELKDLLDHELNLGKFDENKAKNLHTKLMLFKLNFIQKNEEHLLFITSNLTGVYNATFSQRDSENFYNIFNVSEKKLRLLINKLPDIIPEWNVASNPLYLISLYLINKYMEIKYKKLEEIVTIIFEIMSYRMLTSILFQFYQTKLSVDEAKAVYEKFTYKFLVKRLGSWDAVIKYKTGMILNNGTYYKPVERLTTKDAMDVAAAIQTSYKSLIKYIASISHGGDKTSIKSSTVMEMTSDGKSIKEIENQSVYINYLESIMGFENDFVNNGLIKIIISKINNVEYDNIRNTLIYLNKNHNPKDDYLTKIIEYSLEFLNSKNISSFKGNMDYINLLKGYWASGNPKLKNVKSFIKDTTYKATMRKTDWILNSTTIAVICYIFARGLTKNNI